jgi:nicotinamidase/pyrazinamidase
MKILLVVDAQRDFMPGGSLAIEGGDEIVSWINNHRDNYSMVVWTKDWHPENHCSFVKNGGVWPAHCVQETSGSFLHYHLEVKKNEYVVTKGANSKYDSYSAFKDDGGNDTGLTSLLRSKKVEEIDVVGLATDYCVKFTALDALANGFKVNVILAGCRGVSSESTQNAILEMKKVGINVQ